MEAAPKVEPNVVGNLPRFLNWAKRLLAAIAPHSRIVITVETDRVVIVRRRRSTRVWCWDCSAEVDMVGLEEAGRLIGTTPQTLRDGPGADRWHLAEGQDGAPLVCLESLLKSMRTRKDSRIYDDEAFNSGKK